jgi:hypothetical protein
MPKPRRKLPKGIHVHESGSVYICYKNEHGSIIRENTHQTDVNAAKLMLAQARTDVAMKRRFTSLSFEGVKFIDLSMTGGRITGAEPEANSNTGRLAFSTDSRR